MLKLEISLIESFFVEVDTCVAWQRSTYNKAYGPSQAIVYFTQAGTENAIVSGDLYLAVRSHHLVFLNGLLIGKVPRGML